LTFLFEWRRDDGIAREEKRRRRGCLHAKKRHKRRGGEQTDDRNSSNLMSCSRVRRCIRGDELRVHISELCSGSRAVSAPLAHSLLVSIQKARSVRFESRCDPSPSGESSTWSLPQVARGQKQAKACEHRSFRRKGCVRIVCLSFQCLPPPLPPPVLPRLYPSPLSLPCPPTAIRRLTCFY
jgi:hypothetical protein